MQENKYNDDVFFEKYKKMLRSQKGLEGAGEWSTLKNILPDFKNKRVLDLGCGYGWHCMYSVQNGACSAVGIDLSQKMIDTAREKSKTYKNIEYKVLSIEDIDFAQNSFDVVISSLALHYIQDFETLCKKINLILTDKGSFIFSVEHPIFTAQGSQKWVKDNDGNNLFWAVDNYFYEGERKADFLGETVTKHHKTLTTYLNGLLRNGFEIKEIVEPMPDKNLIETIPEMKDEMRRPMMLIVNAKKHNKA